MRSSATAEPSTLAFGPLLRHFRKQQGMTQQDVASKAGISTAYIGLIEQGQRGQRPNRDMVRTLAFALQLNLEDTETFYRAGGHLEDGEDLFGDRDGQGVVEAIEADPTLPDASKRIMINLYGMLSRTRSRRE